MADFVEIPVISDPSQRLSTSLSGRRVDLTFNYNSWADRWCFDLEIDGAQVLAGRRIVNGVDLIEPFNFGIGKIIAAPWGESEAEPGRNELPSGAVRLFHYDPSQPAI